jgi:phosphatidylserine/phosphatidylglycerophosphate/cardiolipin synthase-like enzyme
MKRSTVPVPWLVGLALFSAACGGEDVGSDSADATEVIPETSLEAAAVRALLNDPATTVDVLKKAKVTTKTAGALLAYRAGADGVFRNADDDLFDTIAEVDAVKGVGSATLKNLQKLATELGYLDAQKAKERFVVFSPQPADKSHNVEVAKLIGEAKTSLDIAMYSYSDANIAAALQAAVSRGVKVRFLFETANDDRKLTGSALAASRSGKLEAMGVDVRWVNKIMHHKFMIVDGPRDSAEAADTATIVSGSGNWSNGAATKYDENTMFLTAYPELALRLQQEFNLLWDHSSDLVSNPAIVSEGSTLDITDDLVVEDPGMHVFFTSKNFKVNGTTFSVSGEDEVANHLVAAIEDAEERILIASGHLRSRPVAEALMKKRAEAPDLEIRVYLDGQEFVSESGNAKQISDREACLASATTEKQKDACVDKSFLYGLEVGKTGIDVRYKYYAYRWDTSYAAQMHNKYLIVDDALFSGSYNLSDNAEHNTFENMFLFRGPEFRNLVEEYADRFEVLWKQGDGLLPGLQKKIDEDTTIPVVFPAMSLSWTEVRDLRALIAKECPAVNSETFRKNPAANQVCKK